MTKSLFAGLKEDSYAASCYHLVFIARRLQFIACAFFLIGFPAGSCLLLLMTQLAVFIYTVQVRPYESSKKNRLEIFNEAIIYCCSMVVLWMLYFRNYPLTLSVLGWVFIAFIAVLALWNMIGLMVQTYKGVKL